MNYNIYLINNYLIYIENNINYNNYLLNMSLINYYYFNNSNNLLNSYFNELLLNNVIINNNMLYLCYNIDDVWFFIIYNNFYILYILFIFYYLYYLKNIFIKLNTLHKYNIQIKKYNYKL